MDKQTVIITQQCECCGSWVNQEDLLWDLEADRLVCKACFNGGETK